MLRVVIAPDSFGGTLRAGEAAACIARGWRRARPDDDVLTVPMSDGGEGLLSVLRAHIGGSIHELEVAGPHGKPVVASWLELRDTAYVESAEAAGLQHVSGAARTPLRTTTYGVGQLLEAARAAGVDRVVVGLGGSATVDAGAGALTALGVRLLREDSNGLKVGGGHLHHLQGVDPGWLDEGWTAVDVTCWADVSTPLGEAASRFGPQKGADADGVAVLGQGLARFADVVERDLHVDPALRDHEGSGAAGGLGYGLAAAIGATIVPGAPEVGAAVGLAASLQGADLVVTGEGAIDSTSLHGKVVGHVCDLAREAGIDVAAVVGSRTEDVGIDLEEAAPLGPGPDPSGEVAAAAARLAARLG